MLEIAPRRLILTLYGLYARDKHNWLSVNSVVRLMADLGVDSASVRSSISRLKRRGVVAPLKVGTSVGYSLSPEALEIVREGDVRIFGPERASDTGDLVLVVFSVPESERDRRHQLRTELTRLGFGTVSPGTWVAPGALHDVTVRVLAARGLAPYADIFRASYEHFGNLADRVHKWWDLDAIQAEYAEFISTFEGVLMSWRTSEQRPRHAYECYIPMLTVWRRLPYLDPGLPLAVLPENWSGQRAAELFADLDALLRHPAREHATAMIQA